MMSKTLYLPPFPGIWLPLNLFSPNVREENLQDKLHGLLWATKCDSFRKQQWQALNGDSCQMYHLNPNEWQKICQFYSKYKWMIGDIKQPSASDDPYVKNQLMPWGRVYTKDIYKNLFRVCLPSVRSSAGRVDAFDFRRNDWRLTQSGMVSKSTSSTALRDLVAAAACNSAISTSLTQQHRKIAVPLTLYITDMMVTM